LHKRQNP
ncbi:hypothetical protein D046_1677B, partial [Vibrio parahaemolyticus V-223/04]